MVQRKNSNSASIRETHALFQSEFEDLKIGKSKFSELQPEFVKVSSKLPHKVCLCRYHENFSSDDEDVPAAKNPEMEGVKKGCFVLVEFLH